MSALARASLILLFSLLSMAALGASAAGCKRKGADVTGEGALPPPVVNDKSEGLLFTWIDDKGEFHAEQRATEIPETAREMVRVRILDPSTDAPGGDQLQVVDLRAAGPDGNYPVRAISRSEFEDVAMKRRSKNGTAVLAPKAAGDPATGSANGAANGGDVASRPAVIIYGASWCGPCHQAAAYLKKRGVPFVEHDIEKDSSAAHEMQTKLKKAGVRGGSIPVLDVRGHMLVGFSSPSVDAALAAPP